MTKNNCIKRTFGDLKWLYSNVEKGGGDVIKKPYIGPRKEVKM